MLFLRVFLLLCIGIPMLTACFSSAPEPVKHTEYAQDPELVLWGHADNAIHVDIRADRKLNMYNMKAHSVQLCIYQLDNPAAFRELGKTKAGIATLLKAEAFDKSVKNVTRMFLQPLETTSLTLDRVEGAMYVAAVAGFFSATATNSVGIWPIELSQSKKGIFFTTTYYSAGTMNLALRLSAEALSGVVVNKNEEDAKDRKKEKASEEQKVQTEEPVTSKEAAPSEDSQVQTEQAETATEQEKPQTQEKEVVASEAKSGADGAEAQTMQGSESTAQQKAPETSQKTENVAPLQETTRRTFY